MKTLIVLSMLLSGLVFSSCATNGNEDRVRQMNAEREARQSMIAQYGIEVANAKNEMHRADLIKRKELAGDPKRLKEYINQSRPRKKVLVITESEDRKSMSGEVIEVYDGK